jgi:glycosyltransferase involved in cell wall biosynthesis
VLLVSAGAALGGAERVLLDWTGGLEGPLLLACPPGALAAAAAIEVAPLRARSVRRRGRRVAAAGDLAGLAREIGAVAGRIRPAVVVASGARAVLAAAAARLGGAALVALHHDLPPGPITGALLRAASWRAAASVATSRAIAGPLGGATVIHPGVHVDAWALPDPPSGPPRALMLGALVPWKRADLALEIAARVPELALDVAGAPLPGDPPAFAARVRERARRPDLASRVRLLGHVEDPRTALRDSHLLLHCADREPFGLALVEALAAGRPVVAPAAGGPLEIVTPGAGVLFTPGDAASGAAAVRAALAGAATATAARERARAFAGTAARARFAAVVAAAQRS